MTDVEWREAIRQFGRAYYDLYGCDVPVLSGLVESSNPSVIKVAELIREGWRERRYEEGDR